MNERVTITIPEEVVRDIDRRERNRSRFILRAIQNELERHRKEELRRSLRAPHIESEQLAQAGIGDWMGSLPKGDADLVDLEAGDGVHGVPGQGWMEEAKVKLSRGAVVLVVLDPTYGNEPRGVRPA